MISTCRLLACNAEDYTAQRNPRVIFVSGEIRDDMVRIESLEHGGIPSERVEQSNHANGEEPTQHDRSKHESHLHLSSAHVNHILNQFIENR